MQYLHSPVARHLYSRVKCAWWNVIPTRCSLKVHCRAHWIFSIWWQYPTPQYPLLLALPYCYPSSRNIFAVIYVHLHSKSMDYETGAAWNIDCCVVIETTSVSSIGWIGTTCWIFRTKRCTEKLNFTRCREYALASTQCEIRAQRLSVESQSINNELVPIRPPNSDTLNFIFTLVLRISLNLLWTLKAKTEVAQPFRWLFALYRTIKNSNMMK